MTNYTDCSCPVCKKPFRRDEARPVICPDCGAPYHRACYAALGKCAFEERHKSGYVWDAGSRNTDIPPDDASDQPTDLPESFFNSLKETLDKMGTFEREKPKPSLDEFLIFGVSEKEIAHFQGVTTPARLIRYRQIAAGQKISFNIFAGLFSPYYIFYSRMRAAGIFVSLLVFLLSLPNTLLMFYDTDGAAFPLTTEGLTQAAIMLGYLNFGVRVAIGLFFDYFYLRWTAYRIRLIRSEFIRATIPDVTAEMTFKLSDLGDEYYRVLQNSGRPSILYMLLDSIAVNVALTVLFYVLVF